MTKRTHEKWLLAAISLAIVAAVIGCKSPAKHRKEADRAAYKIIEQAREQALGKDEPFTISQPEHRLRQALLLDQALPHSSPASLGSRQVEPIKKFPDRAYLAETPQTQPAPPWLARAGEGPLVISLDEALMIGARNSREYQTQKETLFLAALDLDLERDEFRNSWAAFLESEATADLLGEDQYGVENRAALELRRRFKFGALFTARLGVDLASLLSGDRESSLGLFGDASVSVPLLRGAGEFITTEPLRQAQRDVIYAVYTFERFKQQFAVQVASNYFDVLETLDRLQNAEQNYRNLIASSRRARRLADAGRLPEIQVDQSLQDELSARDRWVGAEQSFQRALDDFKVLLGLPADAAVTPDPAELDKLVAAVPTTQPSSTTQPAALPADAPIVLSPPDPTAGGPMEIPAASAVTLALDHRLDLRVALGRIDDAQRQSVVAADALRADLTLLGSTSLGERRTLASAGQENANFRFEEGSYSALATLDLPLERTRERNDYRASLIAFERAVRELQAVEDRVKLEVRDDLRTLLEAREGVAIQAQAVQVARRRADSTDLFLQAGRAEIRDVLEAQESLVAAENALTAAIVRYRVTELELQRDLGVLEVGSEGLWRELVLTEKQDVAAQP